jgi:hypothetical protein
VPDLSPKIVKNNNATYLFWIQNNTMIKMVDVNNLIAKSVDEYAEFNIQDENKDLKSGEINIVTTDKLVMNGKINNIYPFVDSDNNIYVVWQQNSNTLSDNDQTGEIDFKQDLYIAGLIETEDNSGETTHSWSNSVRLTDNGKMNDLPTIADLRSGGNKKLLLVNNQYKMKSEGGSDSYDISDSKLQEITFKAASSIDVVSVKPIVVSTNDDGSIKYKVSATLQNTGLYAAKGYSYVGNFTYNGMNIAEIPIQYIDETILPGSTTSIGGVSPSGIRSPDISFTLSKEQQKHIDKVNINLTIKEFGIADEGKKSSLNVFSASKKFEFVPSNIGKAVNSTSGSIDVRQIGDTFMIDCILKNVGKVHSNGNEKVYVIKQDDWDNPIASSEYIDLPIHKQMHFTLSIPESILYDNNKGIEDLVVYVMNDEKEILSDYEIATLNAKVPYNFKVNGRVDKIQVQVGEDIQLNTTYEPSARYKNATILYTVEDTSFATVSNNKIHGVKIGTTKLNLATKEFGGTSQIEVIVTPKKDPTPTPVPGGSSSGSGGAGAGPIVDRINVSRLGAVKANTIKTNSSDVTWVYDPINDSWKIKTCIADSNYIDVKNAFLEIESERVTIINGVNYTTKVSDIYCFDADGKMLTGWVGTADGKWYFFENNKNINEGKMVIGWRSVGGAWYYFAEDGSMLVDTITPDGYKVNAEGKWIQ